MGANWRLLLQAWPTPRGAPLPLPAVMDLLANVFNAETPTTLPVRPRAQPLFTSFAAPCTTHQSSGAPLLSQQRPSHERMMACCAPE